MVLDAHAEPLGQTVDRLLQRRVVERHQAPALIADEVVMMLMWGGLALSYQIAALPPSSAVIGLAAAAYAGATLYTRVRRVNARAPRERAGAA